MREDQKEKIRNTMKAKGIKPPSRKGFPSGNLGKKRSEISKKKMSDCAKERKFGIWMNGKKLSEKSKLKMRESKIGVKHWNWQGGISLNPYPISWDLTLKRSIRERDKYTCKVCSKQQTEKVFDVHHINYDKSDLNPKNLITLCRNCHIKTNYNREFWINYFNNINICLS